MADIRCAVCGEPWDAYGLVHGDVAPWEHELFKKGAGCPCCKGVAPGGRDHTEDHLRSLIVDVATDDPHAFALVNDPEASRPEWKRPPDVVIFQCAGCDSRIMGNVDFSPEAEDLYRYWDTPSVTRHRYGHRDRTGEHPWRWSTDLDELYEVDGKRYCAGCATTCDECGEAVFCTNDSATGAVLFGDTYDAGASHPDPRQHGDTICTACLEALSTCGHCGECTDSLNEDGLCESCAPSPSEAAGNRIEEGPMRRAG